MSTHLQDKLKKVQQRRMNTPDQTGRKSPLRNELPILEIDIETEKKLDVKEEETNVELQKEESEFDECDLEILNILRRTHFSNDQIYFDDEEFQYERSKCPDVSLEFPF